MNVGRLYKIDFIKKFINQSVHSLEECQKTSTRLEYYEQSKTDIEIHRHSFIFKNQTITLPNDEVVIHLNNIELLDRLYVLKYREFDEYVLTMDEYEQCFNRRLFIFVNGVKIKDIDVDVLIDNNKSFLIFRDLKLTDEEIERINIFKVFTRDKYFGSNSSIPIIKDTKVLAFGPDGKILNYSILNEEVVFNNLDEKEVYYINQLKYNNSHDIENYRSYFQLESYISKHNILIFENGLLQNEDRITSYHNTIYRINDVNYNSNYNILGFELDDYNDDNMILDLYLKENPELLLFYIYNFEIINSINNIDLTDYLKEFNIDKLQTTYQGNVDDIIDEFFNIIIQTHPHFFEKYIDEITAEFIHHNTIYVDDKYILDNTRMNVNYDILNLDIPFQKPQILIRVPYVTGYKIYLNGNILNDITMGVYDGKFTFVYVNSDSIKSGDVIYIIKENEIFSTDINRRYTNTVIDNSYIIKLDKPVVSDSERVNLDILPFYKSDNIYKVINDINVIWLDDITIRVEILNRVYNNAVVNTIIYPHTSYIFTAPNIELADGTYEVDIRDLNPFEVKPNHLEILVDGILIPIENTKIVICGVGTDDIYTKLIINNITLHSDSEIEIMYNKYKDIIYDNITTTETIDVSKSITGFNRENIKVYIDNRIKDFNSIEILNKNTISIDNVIGSRVTIFEYTYANIDNSKHILEYRLRKQLGTIYDEMYKNEVPESDLEYLYIVLAMDRIKEGLTDVDGLGNVINIHNEDGLFDPKNQDGFLTLNLADTFNDNPDGITKTIHLFNKEIPTLPYPFKDYFKKLLLRKVR